tara:strand:- start:13 stop:156 length:144 start_codon:yes stop_codon:yes gene_type:complete
MGAREYYKRKTKAILLFFIVHALPNLVQLRAELAIFKPVLAVQKHYI